MAGAVFFALRRQYRAECPAVRKVDLPVSGAGATVCLACADIHIADEMCTWRDFY